MRIHVEFESRSCMDKLRRRIEGTANYDIAGAIADGHFELLVRIPFGTRREFEKTLNRFFEGVKSTKVAIRRRPWLEDFWKRRSACAS